VKIWEIITKECKKHRNTPMRPEKGDFRKEGHNLSVKGKKTNRIAMIYHILDDIDNLSNIFYRVV
jgi:hypothetical protein